jgi:hypothetical protein
MISNRLQAFFCFFLMSFVLNIQAMDQGGAHVGVPQAPQQTQVPQQTWKRWLIQKVSHMLARPFPTWTKIVGRAGVFCGYLGLKGRLFPNSATKGARVANLALNSVALCCSIKRVVQDSLQDLGRARELRRDASSIDARDPNSLLPILGLEAKAHVYKSLCKARFELNLLEQVLRIVFLGFDTGCIMAGYQGLHDARMQNTMKRVDQFMKLGRPDMASQEQATGTAISYLVHGLCGLFRAEPLLRLADKGADTLRAALHDRCERYLQQ